MLEDVTREGRTIREENRIITTKIAKLQTGIEIFTDEQAKQDMRLLYNDLKQWNFSHFGGTSALGEGDEVSEFQERYDTLSVDIIHSKIAGMMYRSFWTTFIVGYGAHWDEHFRILDWEVKKQCKCI